MTSQAKLSARLLFGVSLIALSGAAHAVPVFTDFETVDNVVAPAAPAPTNVGATTLGVPLGASSEVNDEFKIFRITSGAAASDSGDTFGGISSWVNFESPLIAHSGSRVIAGASFGVSSLEVDFKNFIEIRVLDPGYKSIKVWLGAIDGGSARMLITDDLLAGDTLVDTAVTVDGFVEFTSTAGDIRRVLFTPGAGSGGIWIDDLSVDTTAAPPPPPPPTTVPVPASLTLLAPLAAGLVLRRRRQQD